MADRRILALDQGTTSSRSMLFDAAGQIISVAQQEFTQYFPKSGWVEHDANEIWSSQFKTIQKVLTQSGTALDQVAAIGITNQRETTVVWDRATAEPIHHAIVWQDRRTAEYCDSLKSAGHAEKIQQKTGLVLDSYFSGTKLKWILDHVPGARAKAERGELAFGTVDSWLIYKLTEGALHITDASNASRTLLMNIHTGDWDPELLSLLEIPESVLPTIRASSEEYGLTTKGLLEDSDVQVPIAGIAGDQQAALFGQMCTESGMVKNTYGTGCFMLMNTGEKAITSTNNLLTTIAWKIDGKTTYAIEGSVFIAGAVVQWLRDGLKMLKNSPEVETLAAEADDAGGVYLVPAFAGLGAPHWNPFARGAIFGLTRGSDRSHIAKAAVESMAYQTYDILKAMESDAGIAIQELRVDGGACINDHLMQFQSDLLGCNVVRPSITETTALGAAYLAGLGVGFWKDIPSIQNQWQVEQAFTPAAENQKREELLHGWQRAVRATIAWADDR